ncbi:MAG: molybdenum cofactor guanylyltransferase [Pseudomonadota bacterium]
MTVEVRRALVLAGGHSSRMGCDKAALAINGESQLARTVRLAAAEVDRVQVSVRADQADDPLRAGYDCLVDAPESAGPMAGILTALKASAEPWLVLACDLPALDATTLRHLLDNVAPDAPATAYASERDGLPEPLCAVWMPAALGPLAEALAAGRRCPRKLLIETGAPLLQLPVAGALTNVNTPADLRELAGVNG